MGAGEPLGPLHGVPVTIKDLMPMAGVAMRGGSHTTGGRVSERAAPLVERLVADGAIVVGRTTTSEFGWKGVRDSPLTGVTHNPWRYGFKPPADYTVARGGDLSGLRIAFSPHLGHARADPAVGALVREAVEGCRASAP